MRLLLALCLSLLVSLAALPAIPCQTRVQIRVTNCHGRSVFVALGPVDLCAEARIEPQPHNRRLLIRWSSEESKTVPPEGESEAFLDAELDRRLHVRLMRRLTEATYNITAIVYGPGKQVCGRAATQLRIG